MMRRGGRRRGVPFSRDWFRLLKVLVQQRVVVRLELLYSKLNLLWRLIEEDSPEVVPEHGSQPHFDFGKIKPSSRHRLRPHSSEF